MSRRDRKVIILAALMAALLSLAAAVAVFAKATEDDVAKVKPGMSRAEVLDIMGKPDKDQEVKDEGELCRLLAYKSVGRYRVVNIWFDCADKVKAVDKVAR
ncbi:MAG TPA: outer membrane protein assembly factor BamE [Candidatus Xenobia bacterium]|nr:outer membrane protein assembly factor BamE [Candidatus Xenobia bacterium]